MKLIQFLLKLGFVLSVVFQFVAGSQTEVYANNILLSDAPVSAAIEGNIDDLARAILTYFPKVEGRVVGLNEEEIEVDFGGERGLAPGVLLTVYRKGEPFHHPVTGVPLGQFEKSLVTLEVKRFKSPYLLAGYIEPKPDIRVGDLVRITGTRIPLAVSLLSDAAHPFLMNELLSALSDTGRFKMESFPPGTDIKEAREGGNRYHIKLDTSRQDERFSMDLQIQNTLTGMTLAKLSVLIKQSEESDLILEHLQFQLFEQRQKK